MCVFCRSKMLHRTFTPRKQQHSFAQSPHLLAKHRAFKESIKQAAQLLNKDKSPNDVHLCHVHNAHFSWSASRHFLLNVTLSQEREWYIMKWQNLRGKHEKQLLPNKTPIDLYYLIYNTTKWTWMTFFNALARWKKESSLASNCTFVVPGWRRFWMKIIACKGA